ncbi:hypothetical protein A2U01_0105338, partial [Trifolium medium]|nr:hypothetical protein [Trifolium medium]
GLELKPPKNTLFCVLVARARRAMFLRKCRQFSLELPVGEELSATFSPVLARLGRARNAGLNLFL